MTIVVKGDFTLVIGKLLVLGLIKLVNIIRRKRPHYIVVYQLEVTSRYGKTTTRYKLEFYNKKMTMTGGQLVDVDSIDGDFIDVVLLSGSQRLQALPGSPIDGDWEDDDDDWEVEVRGRRR